MEVGVFADQDDGNSIEKSVLLGGKVLPFGPSTLSSFHQALCLGDVVQHEDIPDGLDQTLLLEEEGNVVCRRNVVDGNDLLGFDLAEHGDLIDRTLLQWYITSASNLPQSALPLQIQNGRTHQIRHQTSPSDITNSLLCGLGLLLSLNDRNKRNMDLQEIVLSCPSLQLSHSLDKRRTLDISDSSSQLNNAHIRRLIGIIDGDACYTLDPILNRIGQMRHDLDSLSQVVTATLALNDVLVDLAGSDVVLASQGDVEIALVVSQVEVDFSSVVEYKDLPMSEAVSRGLETARPQAEFKPQFKARSAKVEHSLRRRHSPSIDIHIWINLDRRDVISSA